MIAECNMVIHVLQSAQSVGKVTSVSRSALVMKYWVQENRSSETIHYSQNSVYFSAWQEVNK